MSKIIGGYRDQLREKAALALREWTESPAWAKGESDPETVARIVRDTHHSNSIVTEAAIGSGAEVEARVRASLHEWGDHAPCGLPSRHATAECPSRCLKCSVRLACCAEPACWHFFAYDGSETMPPCIKATGRE